MSQQAHKAIEFMQWMGTATYSARRICAFAMRQCLYPFYAAYEVYLAAQMHTWHRPHHIGIIMDGNRRFARTLNLGSIINGHEQGAAKLEEVLNWCEEAGVRVITVWIFSMDNFKRDPEEVTGLMSLFEKKFLELVNHPRIHHNEIRVCSIGKTDVLPCQPDVNLDVVPVDFVCDALVAIGARDDSAGRVYHLTAGPGRTLPIEEMVDLAVAEGNRYHREIGGPPIATPTIVSPAVALAASDEDREKLQQLYALGQAVMRTHVPYMLTEQLFDTARTDEALEGTGIACPHLRDYFTTLVRWGVERNFGES